jgi:peptidoglycan/LPS O-acetylase OafA/YrhL
MISGFVIFMTLDRTRTAKDFVVSRFSRLYPAYWTSVFITFTIVSVLGLPGKETNVFEFIANLTMFQELLHIKHVDFVYWTLQIELLFYLIMLALFRRNLLRNIEGVLWVWLGLRLAYLLVPLLFGRDLSYFVGKLLIQAYIPFFALGIVFFRIRQAGNPSRMHLGLILSSLLLVYFGESATTFLVACGFTALFWLFIRGRLGILTTKPMVYLGNISYSLYLLHENIGWALIRRLEQLGFNANVAILIALAVVFGLASAVTYLVEKPAMNWIRNRYRGPRPSTSAIPS